MGTEARSVTTGESATSATSVATAKISAPGEEASPFFTTTEAGYLTRRLRTVIVSGFGMLGGAESWLLSMLDASKDRLDIGVILLADGPLRQELEARGIHVIVRATSASKSAMFRASWWLRRQLKRTSPDLVLANGVKAAAIACPAARLVGVRSVWVKHDHSYDKTLARPLAKLATGVIATAHSLCAATKRPDITVIEPPRPVPAHSREAAHTLLREAGIELPQAKVLAMLGRYVPYKGIDTAIRALAQPEAAGWNLVTIGGIDPAHPNEKERLAALATELGVSSRVQLADYLPEAGRMLAAADALAVLTHGGGPGREGYGMSAAEAMAAKLPVIAINDGGPVAKRIDSDDSGTVAGLLIPPADPTALAEALSTLNGPVLREMMGVEGHRRIAEAPDATESGRRFASALTRTALRPGAGLREGPDLTVIAPVFNEGPVITKLLDLIKPQLGAHDEFLLIDGGSRDETRETIRQYASRDSRIKLIEDDGGNIAHSRNVGIRAAKRTFVACTDAGCDPGPNWLNAFRAAAAEHNGMVLGVYHTGMRNWFEKAMAAVAWADPVELQRPTPFRRLYGKILGRWFLPHRVEGRSVGFSTEAFNAAGGFPEYLAIAEDEAFGKNLIGAGYESIHSLDADVIWYQRPSIKATWRQFYGYGHGGGTSKSPLLLFRDAVRVLAYAIAAALPFVLGTLGVIITSAGLAIYLSTPIARLIRRRHNPLLILALPACYLLKDIAKVAGATTALWSGRKRSQGTR
ncbi:MAG: glycosyltransferase [Corynebacteriales bacterium]|nr:glycosyltransferase [Mycobacteriales bacterium]